MANKCAAPGCGRPTGVNDNICGIHQAPGPDVDRCFGRMWGLKGFVCARSASGGNCCKLEIIGGPLQAPIIPVGAAGMCAICARESNVPTTNLCRECQTRQLASPTGLRGCTAPGCKHRNIYQCPGLPCSGGCGTMMTGTYRPGVRVSLWNGMMLASGPGNPPPPSMWTSVPAASIGRRFTNPIVLAATNPAPGGVCYFCGTSNVYTKGYNYCEACTRNASGGMDKTKVQSCSGGCGEFGVRGAPCPTCQALIPGTLPPGGKYPVAPTRKPVKEGDELLRFFGVRPPKPPVKCTGCDKDLCPGLDDYFGTIPALKTTCSKCRPRYNQHPSPALG